MGAESRFPAMRRHCRSMLEGYDLTRYGLTSSYRMHREKPYRNEHLTYVMGLKLTDAGLVTWAHAKDKYRHFDRATLTDKGREVANG